MPSKKSSMVVDAHVTSEQQTDKENDARIAAEAANTEEQQQP